MTRFHTLLARVAACAAMAAASALSASDAAAQQVNACYTNKNGTMYRVGVAGTPADCTSATHKKETWNVTGPQGAAGAPGAPGAPGLSGYIVKQIVYAIEPSAFPVQRQYECPVGLKALGAGWNLPQTAGEFVLDVPANRPTDSGDGWIFRVRNRDNATYNLFVYVICAQVQ